MQDNFFNPTKIVTKSMIGRPGMFFGYDGKHYGGELKSIKRGYAEFVYHIPGKGEFRTLVKVREKRLEMY